MLNKAFISLESIRSNANIVKKRLSNKSKLCAVVKADAYGHGMEVVANTLYNICDCFSVAFIEEAVKLKKIGIKKDVLVMVPFCSQQVTNGILIQAVEHDIILAVHSLHQLQILNQICSQLHKGVRVHIAVDTGMNRYGADILELEVLLNYINSNHYLYLDGGFSHYALPESDSVREIAKNKFLLANKLIKHYNNNATCHISASGGFLKGDYLDMVRIGLLLYGYKPFEDNSIKVNPAMKVYAPTICQRTISSKDGGLYGLKKPSNDSAVSIIAYGYADGLERKEVKGQFNNRCMDASAIYGKKEGFVPIMLNAQDCAKKYGTISYEVLTKVAIRAEKIYY